MVVTATSAIDVPRRKISVLQENMEWLKEQLRR